MSAHTPNTSTIFIPTWFNIIFYLLISFLKIKALYLLLHKQRAFDTEIQGRAPASYFLSSFFSSFFPLSFRLSFVFVLVVAITTTCTARPAMNRRSCRSPGARGCSECE